MQRVFSPRAVVCAVWVFVATAGSSLQGAEPGVPPRWLGTWPADQSQDCKELRCTARAVAGNDWEAVFTGVCSQAFSFQVKMQGRRQEGRVVFEGETDLGEENGGIYRWTGAIADGKFTGVYSSAGGAKKGTFEMKPDAAAPSDKP